MAPNMLPLCFGLLSIGVANARELWYTRAASDWASASLPIGNGKLAASVFGGILNDTWTLNIDNLWTGGPFQDPDYRGGNPTELKLADIKSIQKEIFESGTGNLSAILGSDANYGSYTVLGNLTVSLSLPTSASTSDYKFYLDLDRAVGGSYFSSAQYGNISREYFCAYPSQVCAYHLSSTGNLPDVSIALGIAGRDPAPNVTSSGNTIIFRGQAESPYGMIYDTRATVVFPNTSDNKKSHSTSTGDLLVPASENQTELWIVLSADTNYDETTGNSAAGYTFQGIDPAKKVAATVASAAKKSYAEILTAHVKDYQSLNNRFSLTLPDPLNSAGKSTDEIVSSYDVSVGDPYLESLLFDFGKYLRISSSRANSLPPNLQGKWAKDFSNPWSGDYHTNINLQMNVWGSEAMGLGDLLEGLWRYMTETWVPRGTESARLIYGAEEGWVVHNEINIFGHTGIKGDGNANTAHWFAYPQANAWMMQHVWDHFDYTQDLNWYKTVGYPLIKGVAQFALSTLAEDAYFKDGTLVVNPCNSPEQTPSTFGCSVNQQQIFEVFNNVLKGWDVSGDQDLEFKEKIEKALKKLYSGVRVGRYGQIQEWKLDIDDPDDQHRHLSHLYGWYPGYAISSVHRTNSTITSAVETTLIHRGPGRWTDANAGWAKVWRSACWAGLSNSTEAYYELRFAISQNFANNLYSIYSKDSATLGRWVFQADGNWGFVGATLHMFVHDLDVQNGDQEESRTVIVAPAVPESWWGAKLEGYRLRGGGMLSFAVSENGKVKSLVLKGRKKGLPQLRFVNAEGVALSVETL